jgi:hypothetical protein
MQWDCETHFPNGHVLLGAPSDRFSSLNAWSPDNNYTIVCVGANHDSPCSGYEVLDLVESHYDGVLGQLIEYDAARETETNLAACPDWFYQNYQQATVHISATQAFMMDRGTVTQIKADHLDFHFEKTK